MLAVMVPVSMFKVCCRPLLGMQRMKTPALRITVKRSRRALHGEASWSSRLSQGRISAISPSTLLACPPLRWVRNFKVLAKPSVVGALKYIASV